MYEAREALRAENRIVVVEGYMDVVMLAQHGIRNAVATLGTTTTADHVRKLLRAVDRVVFAFDRGCRRAQAAWRAARIQPGQIGDTKRIDFLFLPPEHDPDSFVRARGAAAFREALDDAMPLSGFLLQSWRRAMTGGVGSGAGRDAGPRPAAARVLSAPGLEDAGGACGGRASRSQCRRAPGLSGGRHRTVQGHSAGRAGGGGPGGRPDGTRWRRRRTTVGWVPRRAWARPLRRPEYASWACRARGSRMGRIVQAASAPGGDGRARPRATGSLAGRAQPRPGGDRQRQGFSA
ncbi:MAG: toprim domain-containing protein [Burkholderiaceae bacterium]